MKMQVDYAGWAYKQGSMIRNWKRRFMILRGKQLSYYDTAHVDDRVRAKGSFQVLTVEKANDIKNGLIIHGTGGRVMKIYTDTFDECTAWCEAITELSVEQAYTTRASMSANLRDSRRSSISAPQLPPVNDFEVFDGEIDRDATHSGWLSKEGGRVKNWKRRFFYLSGRSLSYYDNESMAGSTKGNGLVCGVRVNKDKQYSLDINFEKGRLLRVTADSQDEFNQWFDVLTSTVEGRSLRKVQSVVSMSAPPLHPQSSLSISNLPNKPTPTFSSMESFNSYADGSEHLSTQSSNISAPQSPVRGNNDTMTSWMSSDSGDGSEDDWL